MEKMAIVLLLANLVACFVPLRQYFTSNNDNSRAIAVFATFATLAACIIVDMVVVVVVYLVHGH